MKVYLDACCLNRLTDDQSQPRIRQEAEAVEQLMRLVSGGQIHWVSSEALLDEIDRNPDGERRIENAALLALAGETISVDDLVAVRASVLQLTGYGTYDALHLACAEAAQADALLTTDDGFVRLASRSAGNPRVSVQNPVSWIKENFR